MIRIHIMLAIIALSSCNEHVEKAETSTATGGNFENDDGPHRVTPTLIVIVSDTTPDPYRHPTSHPGSLSEEIDPEEAHGDGSASAEFVGKVVFIGGDGTLQPIPNVKFFQSDDLLGSVGEEKKLLQSTTDANGDFKASLQIFAASGRRKGGDQHEYLIYQTGSAVLDVVADDFVTQRVYVRYEQPSTLIVLKPIKQKHSKSAHTTHEPP